jgi:hypothetical protein
MVDIPPPVDTDGNITLPREGGVIIPVRMLETDNTPIDLTTVPLRFLSEGRIDKMLVVDPDYAGGKILILTDEECQIFSGKWVPFSMLDISGSPPIEVWPGKIRRGTSGV